jgi:UDP-N-acetylmuramoylalanine--D-glutamate ligase
VAPLVRQRVRAVVLLGEASSTIRGAWPGIEHRIVRDLEEAVRTASELAVGGDVVLLSPGCASQDMFRDYQERGDLFREIARRLHGGSPS